MADERRFIDCGCFRLKYNAFRQVLVDVKPFSFPMLTPRRLNSADIERLLKPAPNDLQVNACQNSACATFGVVGAEPPFRVASGGTTLECTSCGEPIAPMSNVAVLEDIYRLRPRGCPDSACKNHWKPLETPKTYACWGSNRSGTPRLRCLACGASFTVEEPEARRDDKLAAKLLTLLMNKAPLTRACEQLDIDHTQLYRTLAFIERRAMAFANRREQSLPQTLWDVFNISIDRQAHSVNWTSRKDRRNATVWATASCDNDTGYCLLVTVDFDRVAGQEGIDLQAGIEYAEREEPPPLRQTARFWLESDLDAARPLKRDAAARNALGAMVTQGRLSANQANWIEQAVFPEGSGRLPLRGALVRPSVHFHAHARLLEEMIHPHSMVRLYLDREPGLDAAMLSAFAARIRDNWAEALHVSCLKDATMETKRSKVMAARLQFRKRVKAGAPKTEIEVLRDELIDAWRVAAPERGSTARWARHPVPSLQEPEKKVGWLSDRGLDINTMSAEGQRVLAGILNKASLSGTDVFFMQARRRVSMLERPLHSAANAGRTWNGYGAYNPAVLVQLFNIFRVWKNYAIVGEKDGKTPAMRMGLARAPRTALQIIRGE